MDTNNGLPDETQMDYDIHVYMYCMIVLQHFIESMRKESMRKEY